MRPAAGLLYFHMKFQKHSVGLKVLARIGQFGGLVLAVGLALFFLVQMGKSALGYVSNGYMPFKAREVLRVVELGSGSRRVLYEVVQLRKGYPIAIKGGQRDYIIRSSGDDAELEYTVGESIPVYIAVNYPLAHCLSRLFLSGVAVLFFSIWAMIMRDLIFREKIDQGNGVGVLLAFDHGNSHLNNFLKQKWK